MKPNQLDQLNAAILHSGLELEEAQFNPDKRNLDLLVDLISSLNSKDSVNLTIRLIRYYKVITNYRKRCARFLFEVSNLHESNIAIVPLIKQPGYTRGSGPVIAYEIRSLSANYEGKFRFFDSPWEGKGLSSQLPKYIVDDFIGTGEQFFDMYEEIRRGNKDFNVAGVFSIACMQHGHQRLIKGNLRHFCYDICEKALDVHLRSEGGDVTRDYSLYEEIEALLDVDAVDHLGRNQSEGLISLKRTPNNTLPIFWHKGREKSWPAPFPR